ncbi:MAG TPA: type 1 glutamine amidotransferase domain-containing protein [Myxococcales bacterium]|jgi:protease I|nr:type 1 glutamine amidotransferase domain-containing protein [Myxococcales bacterium]
MAKVAMIVGEQFEDSEFRIPHDRLKQAGHQVTVIGVQAGQALEGKKGKEKVSPDVSIDQVRAADFDALVIPGGYSPDHLRTNIKMVGFTRELFLAGKPVAAVCHGPSMLVEADVLDGRMVTSWPSVKTDLINAGARWVDREVVEDGRLITSRKPDDLEAFCAAILRQLEGKVPDRARSSVPSEPATVH